MWKDDVYKHLGEYKRNILGIPGNAIKGDTEYEHILPCGMHFANYMCEQAIKESSKIKKHPYWYHLNSSQTMCINFFARLFDESNYSYLSKVISLIINERTEIVKAEFEYNPEKWSSNFDYYCIDNKNHKYYFEIKYTEDEFQDSTGARDPKSVFDRIYRPLIVKHEVLSNCLLDDNWKVFMKCHYQIYRNIAMACTKDDDYSYCIFITMKHNEKTRKKLESAFTSIGETPKNVLCIYWEDLIEQVITLFSEKGNNGNYKYPDILGYYKEFRNKYILQL